MASNYIHIPYWVMNKKISANAKFIYGIVQGFFDGDCFVTNPWIAKRLQCSERVVTRAIKELKDEDMLFITMHRKGFKVTKRILKVAKHQIN